MIGAMKKKKSERSDSVVEFIRYKRGRLYDRRNSCYASLKEVEALAIQRVPFRITLAPTHNDITLFTLCQILLKRMATGQMQPSVAQLNHVLECPVVDPSRPATRVIRYTSNRRLYHQNHRRYCTLGEIEALVLAGTPVQITMHPDKTDVTAFTLCQILAQRVGRGELHPRLDQMLALFQGS
jgi:polyhydroxyalkanoate synthesis regulator protein